MQLSLDALVCLSITWVLDQADFKPLALFLCHDNVHKFKNFDHEVRVTTVEFRYKQK
jgi:DUF1365 family protein